MNKRLYGIAGILLIAAAIAVARIPSETNGGMVYTGLIVSENIREYPVAVAITPANSSDIGIALQDSELDFGIISCGMRARKTVNLRSGDAPAMIRLWADGNISDVIGFSKNGFVLNGSDSVEISVKSDMEGNYSGTLYISSKKPRYRWLGGLVTWL